MTRNPFTERLPANVPAPGARPLSEGQRFYLRDLMIDRATLKGMDLDATRIELDRWLDGLTFEDCRDKRMIDRAKADNARLRKLYGPLAMDALGKPQLAPTELEDGMYVTEDGTIWKVYHTVHGRNVQVAKEIVITKAFDDPNADIPIPADTAEFVYRGMGPLPHIAKGRRLTLDEAREFGHLYGVCCRCAATLTDELSIHLGIGPICGGREFDGDFKIMLKEARAAVKIAS